MAKGVTNPGKRAVPKVRRLRPPPRAPRTPPPPPTAATGSADGARPGLRPAAQVKPKMAHAKKVTPKAMGYPSLGDVVSSILGGAVAVGLMVLYWNWTLAE